MAKDDKKLVKLLLNSEEHKLVTVAAALDEVERTDFIRQAAVEAAKARTAGVPMEKKSHGR